MLVYNYLQKFLSRISAVGYSGGMGFCRKIDTKTAVYSRQKTNRSPMGSPVNCRSHKTGWGSFNLVQICGL